MNNLYTYIAAIKGEKTKVTLKSAESFEQSYTDNDVVVNCKESVFHFTNGVVLKYCNESDLLDDDAQICPECWISYEVMSESGDLQIYPKKKTFINQCQEAFWLKINRP